MENEPESEKLAFAKDVERYEERNFEFYTEYIEIKTELKEENSFAD